MRNRLIGLVGAVLLALVLTACGGDDDDTTDAGSTSDSASASDDAPADDADATADTSADDADESEQADDAPAASGGGGGGEVVLGDETITLDSARCFLEEQDAAGGGGKILFVGQGFGTNAAGDEVILDVSRYDEDSQFTGDDIILDVGDFATGISWNVTADLGTVQLDGRTMSADGLTFVNWDDFSEMAGSFVLNC